MQSWSRNEKFWQDVITTTCRRGGTSGGPHQQLLGRELEEKQTNPSTFLHGANVICSERVRNKAAAAAAAPGVSGPALAPWPIFNPSLGDVRRHVL